MCIPELSRAPKPSCPKPPATSGTNPAGIGSAHAGLSSAHPGLGSVYPARFGPDIAAQPKKGFGGGKPPHPSRCLFLPARPVSDPWRRAGLPRAVTHPRAAAAGGAGTRGAGGGWPGSCSRRPAPYSPQSRSGTRLSGPSRSGAAAETGRAMGTAPAGAAAAGREKEKLRRKR